MRRIFRFSPEQPVSLALSFQLQAGTGGATLLPRAANVHRGGQSTPTVYDGRQGAWGSFLSRSSLDIWTPAKSPNDRIPVLAWIYGGGFSFGATSEPVYSGEKLAKKGVVLVSIAYRVGQLGFLAHPELSAESANHVSGNYGLLDMIAGLHWVQKNIAAFGGDPDKVTIFGESAGGIAVSMLCSRPWAARDKIEPGDTLWIHQGRCKAEAKVGSMDLRALPGAMAAVFGVRKCHTVKRDGQTVRGFKSVTIRDDAQ
jgi:Carboxylesterase family